MQLALHARQQTFSSVCTHTGVRLLICTFNRGGPPTRHALWARRPEPFATQSTQRSAAPRQRSTPVARSPPLSCYAHSSAERDTPSAHQPFDTCTPRRCKPRQRHERQSRRHRVPEQPGACARSAKPHTSSAAAVRKKAVPRPALQLHSHPSDPEGTLCDAERLRGSREGRALPPSLRRQKKKGQ